MKADIAFAVAAPLALRVRGRDPEQRLAVAPAGKTAAIVLELEAEETENFVVKVPRARKVAHAQDQVIDTDDVGHAVPMMLVPSGSGHINAYACRMSSVLQAPGAEQTTRSMVRFGPNEPKFALEHVPVDWIDIHPTRFCERVTGSVNPAAR